MFSGIHIAPPSRIVVATMERPMRDIARPALEALQNQQRHEGHAQGCYCRRCEQPRAILHSEIEHGCPHAGPTGEVVTTSAAAIDDGWVTWCGACAVCEAREAFTRGEL